MKTRTHKNYIATLIKNLVILLIVIFDIWMIASWLNVGFNNASPEAVQNIWTWNFFKVIPNLF